MPRRQGPARLTGRQAASLAGRGTVKPWAAFTGPQKSKSHGREPVAFLVCPVMDRCLAALRRRGRRRAEARHRAQMRCVSGSVVGAEDDIVLVDGGGAGGHGALGGRGPADATAGSQ